MFLPRARVVHQLAAALLQRQLDHLVAVAAQRLHRARVGLHDRRVAVAAPHVLEQDDGARFELARLHAAEQHLLVEGDHEVGLVAAVGDGLRADADADAAGAGHAARRRLDLGRDDLDRPDAVAHARGDRRQRLAAALRALARVADDLDDVLGQFDRRAGGGVGAGEHGVRGAPALRRGGRARSCARGGRCRTGPWRRHRSRWRRSARCRAARGRPSSRARPGGRRPWPGSRWPRR